MFRNSAAKHKSECQIHAKYDQVHSICDNTKIGISLKQFHKKRLIKF